MTGFAYPEILRAVRRRPRGAATRDRGRPAVRPLPAAARLRGPADRRARRSARRSSGGAARSPPPATRGPGGPLDRRRSPRSTAILDRLGIVPSIEPFDPEPAPTGLTVHRPGGSTDGPWTHRPDGARRRRLVGPRPGLGGRARRGGLPAGDLVARTDRPRGGRGRPARATRHGASSSSRAMPRSPGTGARIAAEAQAALGPIDIVVLNAGGPPAGRPDRDRRRRLGAGPSSCWRSPRSSSRRALLPGHARAALGPGRRDPLVRASASRSPTWSIRMPAAERLAAWLKTTARAVAADGVTVNGVLPGRLETPRIDSLDRGRAERTGETVEAVRAAHLADDPGRPLRATRGARAATSPTSAPSRRATRRGRSPRSTGA